jgi:hypothetical protein
MLLQFAQRCFKSFSASFSALNSVAILSTVSLVSADNLPFFFASVSASSALALNLPVASSMEAVTFSESRLHQT